MSEKWDRQLSEKWDMLNLGTPHPLDVSEKWDTFFDVHPPLYCMSEKWDIIFYVQFQGACVRKMGYAPVRKMGYAKFGYTPPPKGCQKNGMPFFAIHPPQNHMSEKWDTYFWLIPTPI